MSEKDRAKTNRKVTATGESPRVLIMGRQIPAAAIDAAAIDPAAARIAADGGTTPCVNHTAVMT